MILGTGIKLRNWKQKGSLRLLQLFLFQVNEGQPIIMNGFVFQFLYIIPPMCYYSRLHFISLLLRPKDSHLASLAARVLWECQSRGSFVKRASLGTRLSHNEPFHAYRTSKPSNGQPDQCLLPTFLILKAITISGFDLKFLYYQ